MKFIAELCQNHLGKTYNVEKLLEACVKNKADIVKLQYINSKNLSFRPRFEYGIKIKNKVHSIKRPFKKEYDRLKKLDLPEKFYSHFVRLCEKHGVKPLITCFTLEDVKKIARHGYEEIKVASYDCASFPLIKDLKKHFKKLYISTGSTFDHEIKKTAEILKDKNFIFLHCVTIYPTPLKQINFLRLNFLKRFSKNVGYSDHSVSTNSKKNLAAELGIYFGAEYIERHVRFLDSNKTKDGPVSILPNDIFDLKNFSKLTKNEMRIYFKTKYNILPEKFLGKEKRELSNIEMLNRDYYRGRFVSKIKHDNKIHDIYNWDTM